jgi:hypothetical protein
MYEENYNNNSENRFICLTAKIAKISDHTVDPMSVFPAKFVFPPNLFPAQTLVSRLPIFRGRRRSIKSLQEQKFQVFADKRDPMPSVSSDIKFETEFSPFYVVRYF